MTITNDKGEDILVLTQEEVAAQNAELEAKYKAELEAKDAHVKEKLEQLNTARSGADKASEEAKRIAEEAKRIAEESQKKIEEANKSAIETKRDYWVKQVAGNDPELTKKIMDAYEIINLPATNDTEIMDRVQKAVNMAGITAIAAPNVSFGGAQAPNFQKAANADQKQAEYEAWKKDLSL